MSRTVVVTGGSAGIGLAAARLLAERGDRVILLGRHERRLTAARESVGAAAAIRADFADLGAVRRAADRIDEPVDVLVNNAGGLYGGTTAIRVNHLAGFLLAHLLLDRFAATGRIVTTASLAEAWGVLDVDEPLRTTRSRWLAYGGSKQANLLFTREAARRWAGRGILPVAFFPGLVRSRFAGTSPLFVLGKPLYLSPARAADTLVWLATAPPGELAPGGYYFLRQPFFATPRSTSADRARRLWESSLRAVGEGDLAPER
ncbi:SDR family NAD(P)-dependent oxidoreductase [Dactylosporangium sucinum]|uniref:Short-chain dehydrogenase n=1 Tax=Dactylosporangium sucinum TaxID=1424081 RepID=A0A917WLM8_9ACTN|nr:SDR family NAD(P)-dependent oxidoreductase [Dactylosporangium sucinum]GGM14709.1 short-chain dehydrogenase [Dactylosporangium sucinum]